MCGQSSNDVVLQHDLNRDLRQVLTVVGALEAAAASPFRVCAAHVVLVTALGGAHCVVEKQITRPPVSSMPSSVRQVGCDEFKASDEIAVLSALLYGGLIAYL